MSKNRHGLDHDYFERKIAILHRDGLANWTPEELARELARMSKTASAEVMHEPEFAKPDDSKQWLWQYQTRGDWRSWINCADEETARRLEREGYAIRATLTGLKQ